jgi:spore maturation protein SpmB
MKIDEQFMLRRIAHYIDVVLNNGLTIATKEIDLNALYTHLLEFGEYCFAFFLTDKCMSQANVVFPMLSVGLNLPVILATSVIGGLFAATVTYYLLARGSASEPAVEVPVIVPGERRGTMEILAEGGQEGMKIALASLPILILALCFVYTLQASGAITLISAVLAPLLALLGLPEAAVLPIVTKFIAGGTAFMGVVLDLMNQGLISAADLNRMAGFVTNPLDLAGVAIMTAAGKRVGRVARAAIWGALAGMLLRGVLHLLIF